MCIMKVTNIKGDMKENKEHLKAIITLVEFKIESINRDNERRLKQFQASQNLQIMDLEQILNNLKVIADKLIQE